MLILITIACFLSLLALSIYIYNRLYADKQAVQDRIEKYVDKSYQPEIVKPESKAAAQGKPLGGLRSLIRKISRYFESPQVSRRLEHKLIQAGIPMRGSEFLVVCCGSALVTGVVLFIITGAKIGAGVMGIPVGAIMPLVVLHSKIAKRAKAFNDQLGDSLILVANSLRTGYSFMQAIDMVSREMPNPISEEFARLLKEMNLGVTTEDAMNNLAKRVDSDDLDLVVTAVLIQRQVGGNLAEVLENIATTIRERIKIKGKIKTLTAQGRVSGIIVGLLPIGVGLMIYILNPEYIQTLFTNPLGRAMIAGGIVSEILGLIIIRKIVDIEI